MWSGPAAPIDGVLMVIGPETLSSRIRQALGEGHHVVACDELADATRRLIESPGNVLAVLADAPLLAAQDMDARRRVADAAAGVPVVLLADDPADAAELAEQIAACACIPNSGSALAHVATTLELAARAHRAERQRALLRYVVDNVSGCLLTVDANGAISMVNELACETFGYSRSEAVGMPLDMLLPRREGRARGRTLHESLEAKSDWAGEIGALHKNGAEIPMHVSMTFPPAGVADPAPAIVLADDLSDQQRILDRLKHLSITDDLTGVYNVRYLWARFRYEFLRARRYNQPLSCLLLDLDHFKSVNDRYGHRTGDEVLKRVTEAVARGIREVDILARYGGEEFVVILPNTQIAGAEQCAESIRRRIEELAMDIGDRQFQVTLSVGIAVLTHDATDEDELLRRADDALLRAKRSGRNRACVWAAEA